MSRLIIKNLPEYFSNQPEKLKEYFVKYGLITDIQLKYTPNGKFRKFAFIGFSTDEQAQNAIKNLNRTFINCSKILVEPALDLRTIEKPRAWSKYSKESSASTISKKKPEADTLNEKPRKKTSKTKYFIKISNLPDKITETKIKNFLGSEITNDISDIRLIKIFKRGEGIKSSTAHIAYIYFFQEETVTRSMKLNKSLLKNRFIEIEPNIKNDKINLDTNICPQNDLKFEPADETEIDKMSQLMDTGRIFIRNLPYLCTENDIEELFSKFGKLTEVNLPRDKSDNRIKGFGFVTFMFPEHAQLAFSQLDGTNFKGRLLHLLPGQENKSLDMDANENTQDSGYKKTSLSAKIKNAGKTSHTWNALFINADAIASTISQNYNVDKRQIFFQDDNQGKNSKGNSAAVKMALGETEIVDHIRNFLLQNGVNLDAFKGSKSVRSKTCILVKNLPHSDSNITNDIIVQTLKQTFEKHGLIQRLVVPPHKYALSALIEFVHPQDARNAFREIAYKKIFGSIYAPVFLEWAPEQCFTAQTQQNSQTINNTSVEKLVKTKNENDIEMKNADSKMDVDTNLQNSTPQTEKLVLPPNCTIFVKNLNFSTLELDLLNFFGDQFCPRSQLNVRIAYKRDPTHVAKKLSMGYGFVTFPTRESAEEALKVMQGKMLQNHFVELDRANKELQTNFVQTLNDLNDPEKIEPKQPKILVKNIPFQASLAEIRELFSTFGPIKSIRMPVKLSLNNVDKHKPSQQQHKGFGFVEYFNLEIAKQAFKSLSQSTHLYGRRLVLEWADTPSAPEQILLDEKTPYWLNDNAFPRNPFPNPYAHMPLLLPFKDKKGESENVDAFVVKNDDEPTKPLEKTEILDKGVPKMKKSTKRKNKKFKSLSKTEVPFSQNILSQLAILDTKPNPNPMRQKSRIKYSTRQNKLTVLSESSNETQSKTVKVFQKRLRNTIASSRYFETSPISKTKIKIK